MSANYHRVLLGVALAAFLVAAAWSISNLLGDGGYENHDLLPGAGSRAYTAVELTIPEEAPSRWERPVSQPWDRNAVFEVFTPPIIYFDPESGRFTLRPPVDIRAGTFGFGLEVVSVRRNLYRLQYEGFAGRAGDYFVLLRNEETGLGVRVRSGERLPELDCVVELVEVDRRFVDREGGTPVMEEAVKVVLFDERIDQQIELSAEPRFDPGGSAVVRIVVDDAPGSEVTLKEGETTEWKDWRFRIVEIDYDAGSVTVEKSPALFLAVLSLVIPN